MVNHTHCSEIESLLIQFVSAFDDGKIVQKYKDEDGKDVTKTIIPRWIVSGKSRVLADIINQAENVTFPVAVVEPSGVKLSQDRIFNKNSDQRINKPNPSFYKQPTPVDISVTVNFYTKYFSELWQMYTNFAAYSNPYVFASWQTPMDKENKTKSSTDEIRAQMTWAGDFSIDYPKTLAAEDLWVIHGTASFTIQGWIFAKPVGEADGIIYSVHNHGNAMGYNVLYGDGGEKDFVRKDGWPSITNVFVSTLRLSKQMGTKIPVQVGKKIKIEGRSFFKNQCSGIMIIPTDKSIDLTSDKLQKTEFVPVKMEPIVGYCLMEDVSIASENYLTFILPDLPDNLGFDVLVFNNAGYASVFESEGYKLVAKK